MAWQNIFDQNLIHFLATARHLEISEKTSNLTLTRIIDTIGVALGGTGAGEISAMAAFARSLGSNPQSLVPVLGIKTAPSTAAWLMGAMAHSLDFDDTHDQLNHIHSGAPVVAAAIAVSQAYGPVSGKDFIDAVTIGQEVACRLSKAGNKDLGWHRTSLFGSFGAMAACVTLLQLTEEEIGHAFGIVLSHASGTRQAVENGGDTKTLQAGQAASDGVTAALLAKQGLKGPKYSLSGKFGLFRMYCRDAFELDTALGHL